MIGAVATNGSSFLAVPPVAILPRYTTPEPDEPLALYDGQIEISWAEETAVGPGTVTFEWQPFPHVAFTVDLQLAWETPDTTDDVKITLLDRGGSAEARAWRIEQGVGAGALHHRAISGSVTSELLVGNPAATSTVIVHVPNFPDSLGESIQQDAAGGALWKGRMTSTTATWQLNLDSVPGLTQLREKMGRRRCHAITHVGEITRLDQAPVPFESVERICDVLCWWLSLVRCERTGPILVMGVHEGETVWEIWRAPTLTPWRGRWTWLPQLVVKDDGSYEPVTAGETLHNVDAAWSDDDLKRAIVRAIDWFTQGVASSHSATTVVLAQAGLELMTWLRLVRDVGLTDDAAGKLTAADALRLTLSFAGISTAVPPSAAELHQATKGGPGGLVALDAPGAITEIRNGVVHAKSPGRFNDVATHEGGQLALELLELLLLSRLGYDGTLYSRIDWSGPAGVPWA